jgi:hypothetical protein
MKIDGGPLTTYAYNAKGRTKPVTGTSLHRTFYVLNDSHSPMQIRAFDFTTKELTFNDHSCSLAPDPRSLLCGRLMYDLKWTYDAKAAVLAWEFQNSVFDVMNRFLWDDTSSVDPQQRTQGIEAAVLEPGRAYEFDRAFWWNAQETRKLGEWVTSVVYVRAVRTKEGKVWNFDKDGLRDQIKSLSLEIPAELR